MLAKRANESFDSLVRLIHDTGVACNLQSYPADSKWIFSYAPYGASDDSGLAAETDQADGAQMRGSSTYDDPIVDFRQGSKSGLKGPRSPNGLPFRRYVSPTL